MTTSLLSIAEPETRAIVLAHDAVCRLCGDNPLATIGEGPVKVAVARRLLEEGYTLLERTTKGGAKQLKLANGVLTVTPSALPAMAPHPGESKKRLSPDLRVIAPAALTFEIQCRSLFGSQDALFSDNLLDDLLRISTGRANVLVFATDRVIYDQLRGIKSSTRGRKAKAPGVFQTLFPPSVSLDGEARWVDNSHGGIRILALGSVTASLWGAEKVVITALGGTASIPATSVPA